MVALSCSYKPRERCVLNKSNCGYRADSWKAIYAFNILFVFSQVFAKISIVCFIRLLTPVLWHRRFCTGISVVSILWGLVAAFALAFQCHLPAPWAGGTSQCINRHAMLTAIEVLNILIDITLVVFPSFIVWKLQQKRKRRILIIATFCSRLV